MHRIALIVFAALSFIAAPAFAQNHGTKEEAVAMVKRVQDMFKKDGADATFKAVSDPSNKDFHDRDLYAYIYTLSGVCVAHGARPTLIGRDLSDIKDQDGNYIHRLHLAIAEGSGSGWVHYKWPNPQTNKIEDKTSYVEKMGDYYVGVGVSQQ